MNVLYIAIILCTLMMYLYALKRSKGNFNLFIQHLNHRVENVMSQLRVHRDMKDLGISLRAEEVRAALTVLP